MLFRSQSWTLKPSLLLALRKYFTLTDADFSQVALCRGASNKLGFSVQLCPCAGEAASWRIRAMCQRPCCRCWHPRSACCQCRLPATPRTTRQGLPISSAFASTSDLCVVIGRSANGCSPTSRTWRAMRLGQVAPHRESTVRQNRAGHPSSKTTSRARRESCTCQGQRNAGSLTRRDSRRLAIDGVDPSSVAHPSMQWPHGL